MLFELYLVLTGITVVFIVLSWLKVGRVNVATYEDGTQRDESGYEVSPVYVWLAVILCTLLSVASLDIRVLTCDATLTMANTTVANITTYTNAMLCSEYLVHEIGLSWFWAGMTIVHLVWAIILSLLTAFGAGRDIE